MIDAAPEHPEGPFDTASAISSARVAQREWVRLSIADRLKPIREFRHFIAGEPCMLAAWCNRDNMAESLSAEVLPVLDACRFLEKTAAKALKPKRLSGRGRSAWLRGVSVELQRDPFGVVLIVAPSNYPLMLPGIQALQALVAGNAVVWKPAAGCSDAAVRFREFLTGAGLDERLLTVLPDTVEAVEAAIESGVDKVVLTGSAPTGRAIQSLLAEKLVPSTLELSGCDAMFVTPTANLNRAVKCLVMGLTFNGSRTCIAPRRVFVDEAVVCQFEQQLVRALTARDDGTVLGASEPQVGDAIAAGATLVHDSPVVLTGVTPDMDIAKADVFEPITSIMPYRTIEDAIEMNNKCPYALGATVFGSDDATLAELVGRIDAGCIVVNDMIVPTADPRVPFGGRKQSGFGITRGAAGLEEMTQVKAIVRQRSSFLPHLDEPTPVDADVLAGLIQTLHAPGLFGRMKNSVGLLKAVIRQRKHRKRQ